MRNRNFAVGTLVMVLFFGGFGETLTPTPLPEGEGLTLKEE